VDEQLDKSFLRFLWGGVPVLVDVFQIDRVLLKFKTYGVRQR
jgi:hypothetical protein